MACTIADKTIKDPHFSRYFELETSSENGAQQINLGMTSILAVFSQVFWDEKEAILTFTADKFEKRNSFRRSQRCNI